MLANVSALNLNLSSGAVAVISIKTMASNRSKRQEETHFRVMQILHENPRASTRDVARALGISNGSAYYCISELLEKGFIKFKNFTKSTSKSHYWKSYCCHNT